MKAVVFDGMLRVDAAFPEPVAGPGQALVQTLTAGICRTDLEIVKGYAGFRGVLGHEFVGRVLSVTPAVDAVPTAILPGLGSLDALCGRRVVGEINVPCGVCDLCRRGLGRHCSARRTLGIHGLDGCFRERLILPVRNLHVVPDDVSDDAAVFTEPLAAAYEILEQIAVAEADRVVVLGDGKLGILCAWVLSTVAVDVTLLGHHPEKLAVADWNRVRVTANPGEVKPGADLVIEATGSGRGLEQAISLTRPRGTLVLKSTIVGGESLNLAQAVVNELTIVGSRCGPFARALQALRACRFPVERLIAARFPLDRAPEAFDLAARRGAGKVLFDVAGA